MDKDVSSSDRSISESYSRPQDTQLTQWQQQVEPLLELFQHNLRGDEFTIEYDDDGKVVWRGWKKGKRKPIMNDEGIRFIINYMRTHCNQINYMSNLNAMELYYIIRECRIDFARTLILKEKDWEFDVDYRNVMTDEIIVFIFISLKRALDQGERKFLKDTVRISESHVFDKARKNRMIPFFR